MSSSSSFSFIKIKIEICYVSELEIHSLVYNNKLQAKHEQQLQTYANIYCILLLEI